MLLGWLFDALEMNNLTLWECWRMLLHFFVANVVENERKGALQLMIPCISSHLEALHGYESKA